MLPLLIFSLIILGGCTGDGQPKDTYLDRYHDQLQSAINQGEITVTEANQLYWRTEERERDRAIQGGAIFGQAMVNMN